MAKLGAPIPRPDDVVGPPLEQYFTQAQLDHAVALAQAKTTEAFWRRSLLSIAAERFRAWWSRHF